MSQIREALPSIEHGRTPVKPLPAKPLPQIPAKCPPQPPPRAPPSVPPRENRSRGPTRAPALEHQQPFSEFLEEIRSHKLDPDLPPIPPKLLRRHSFHDSSTSPDGEARDSDDPPNFSRSNSGVAENDSQEDPQSPRDVSPEPNDGLMSPRTRRKSIFERGLQKLTSAPRVRRKQLREDKLHKKNTDEEAINLAMQFIEEKFQSDPLVDSEDSGDINSPRADTVIFGAPVQRGFELGTEASQLLGVPLIVYRCVERLRPCVGEEGIFRLSGAHTRIQYWKARYDAGEDPALAEEEPDQNVVSGLLKQYLRELPDSLLTGPMLAHFEAALQLTNSQAQTLYINSLLQKLPQVNFSTLMYILGFFVEIAQHSDTNLMGIQNLALILSPGLRCSAGVVQIMLDSYDTFIS